MQQHRQQIEVLQQPDQMVFLFSGRGGGGGAARLSMRRVSASAAGTGALARAAAITKDGSTQPKFHGAASDMPVACQHLPAHRVVSLGHVRLASSTFGPPWASIVRLRIVPSGPIQRQRRPGRVDARVVGERDLQVAALHRACAAARGAHQNSMRESCMGQSRAEARRIGSRPRAQWISCEKISCGFVLVFRAKIPVLKLPVINPVSRCGFRRRSKLD